MYFICRVVEFASMTDMKRALEKLDGAELNGRKLKITEERGRGGGGGARGFNRRRYGCSSVGSP